MYMYVDGREEVEGKGGAHAKPVLLMEFRIRNRNLDGVYRVEERAAKCELHRDKTEKRVRACVCTTRVEMKGRTGRSR